MICHLVIIANEVDFHTKIFEIKISGQFFFSHSVRFSLDSMHLRNCFSIYKTFYRSMFEFFYV